MIVGHGWIYIAIPRTASRAMSSTLRRARLGTKVPGDRHMRDFGDELAGHLVWTVVRNPFVRVRSHWERRTKKTGELWSDYLKNLPNRDDSQVWFLACARRLECRELAIKYESLPEGLGILPFRVPFVWKPSEKERRAYTAGEAEAVLEHHGQDFVDFQYDRDSWRAV